MTSHPNIASTISAISRGGAKINVSCYMINFFWPWPPPLVEKWFPHAWKPMDCSSVCTIVWRCRCCCCMLSVVLGNRINSCRRGHWLLLLLPGSEELSHHGIIQKPHTAGPLFYLLLLNISNSSYISKTQTVRKNRLLNIITKLAAKSCKVMQSNISKQNYFLFCVFFHMYEYTVSQKNRTRLLCLITLRKIEQYQWYLTQVIVHQSLILCRKN